MTEFAAIPEHLPGEPPLKQWSSMGLALGLARRLALLGLTTLIALPLWTLYLALRLFRRRPPHLTPLSRRLRYLRLLAANQLPPGLPKAAQLALMLALLQDAMLVPLKGLAWYADELLYGRELRGVQIRQPLIELSAARSGSTQLARYLEQDPQLCRPLLIQQTFPYLWLWRLAPKTLGKRISRERAQQLMEQQLPEAFLERHEVLLFQTETLEIPFLLGYLMPHATYLGPQLLAEEYQWSRITAGNRALWQDDFLRYFDALARKTLAYNQPASSGPAPRLFVKGHFQAVATALEQRYPDARFLTMLRAPDKRIQSMINYRRSFPHDPICGPMPWPAIVAHDLQVETSYCQEELAWHQRPSQSRRCVVRFDDYVRDLEGTMRRVYRECLDVDELPDYVPRSHAPRKRSNYLIDRSLEQLALDGAELNQRLASYLAWCQGEQPGAPGPG